MVKPQQAHQEPHDVHPQAWDDYEAIAIPLCSGNRPDPDRDWLLRHAYPDGVIPDRDIEARTEHEQGHGLPRWEDYTDAEWYELWNPKHEDDELPAGTARL